MVILILIFIASIVIPLVFGVIIGRVTRRKLIEKGNKYATALSIFTFIISAALMFYAIALFVDHNFRFER